MNPRPDEKNEGGIIVEIKLKELEQKSAEVATEWSIVPGRGGRPTLVYLSVCLYLCSLQSAPHKSSNFWGYSFEGLIVFSSFLCMSHV